MKGVDIVKQRSIVTGIGLLFLLFLLIPSASGQKETGAAPKDFLKVGQRYNFNTTDLPEGNLTGEVLAKPDGNWVKVRLQRVGQPEALINLAYVKSIVSVKPKK
jgi:hypothetical protein